MDPIMVMETPPSQKEARERLSFILKPVNSTVVPENVENFILSRFD